MGKNTDQIEYFRVTNWEKYQHRDHKKSMPWIKLYTSILHDYQFTSLDYQSQLLYLKVLLLAGLTGNVLPYEGGWLVTQLGYKSLPRGFEKLFKFGLLTKFRRGETAPREDKIRQDKIRERKTGEKKGREGQITTVQVTGIEHPANRFLESRDPILNENFKTLIDYWNSKPELKSYAEAKRPRNPKKWFDALQSGDSIEEFWKPCIDVMASDDFYHGQAKLTLDWLITSGKADQVFAKKGSIHAKEAIKGSRIIR